MRIWNNEAETGNPSPYIVTVTGPRGPVAYGTGSTLVEAVAVIAEMVAQAIEHDAQGTERDRLRGGIDALRAAQEILDDAIIE